MTHSRSRAALLSLCGALALAAASSASQPAPASSGHPADAGTPSRTKDAGTLSAASTRDGGPAAGRLSAEDVEVVSNLELLEHLPESDVLDLLLPVRDE